MDEITCFIKTLNFNLLVLMPPSEFARKLKPQKMSVKTEDYLYALQQRNLVYNHDFRYFSNRVLKGNVVEYGVPDGWVYQAHEGGRLDYDSLTHQFVIQKSDDSSEMQFSQAIHEFPRWQQMLHGETVTAKVVLSADIDGEIKVSLFDGISRSSVTHTTSGILEFDLQIDVDQNARQLVLSISTSVANMVIKISSCLANVGQVALKHLPCMVVGVIGERKQYIATEHAPAEELSLCNGVADIPKTYTRLRSVINNRFGTNPENNNPYLINMSGYFSRAWNNGANVDPDARDRKAVLKGNVNGDHVGTVQKDEFKKHSHQLLFSQSHTYEGDRSPSNGLSAMNTSNTDREGGNETRPTNITELYTIKWA